MTQRTFSRRTVLGLAAAGFGSAALAACGGDSSASGGSTSSSSGGTGSGGTPVKLSLWTHDQGYIDYFTDYAIELGSAGAPFAPELAVTQASTADVVTKALAAYAAKAATPDLLGIEIGQFSRFMKDGIADQVLLDLGKELGSRQDDFFQARLSPYTSEGKLYALESSFPLAAYYYREDLLQKLKIDPASLESWDDVLSAGERTAAEGVALGVVATGGDPGAVLTHFAILMQQRGGSFFDDNGELALDSRESVDALTVLVEGLKSGAFVGLSDFFGGPGTAVLKQGKTAGYFMPDWFNVFILAPSVPEQSGKWRISGLPRFAGGGSRTSVMGGTGFAVSKDKDTTEAAYDLLSKTYLTPEGQLMRFKQLRYLPTMKSVWEDPEFLAYSDEFLGGQETSALYAELVAEAPAQNQSVHWNLMQTELSKQLIDAYNGKTSPAAAIKNAVTAIEAQIR